MQKVHVETSQNVLIIYEVATLGDRILAYIIDSLIIVGSLIFFAVVIFEILPGNGDFVWVWSIVVLGIVLYPLLFEIFNDGQSPGKMQMKIKVVKKDGTEPTIGAYLLRWIIRFIDVGIFPPFTYHFGIIGILFIAIGGKGQRLGDIAAGTTVIKLRQKVASPKKEVISKIESDYKPTFPQAAQLSSKNIDIILAALSHYRKTSDNQPVLAIYRKTIDLLKVKTDMEPVAFLHMLVKDYNHYATYD